MSINDPLCSPSTATGISQMMQSLGRMYVVYFNQPHLLFMTLDKAEKQRMLS